MFVRCIHEEIDNPDFVEPPWGKIYYEDWHNAQIQEENGKRVLVLNPDGLWGRFPAEKLDSFEFISEPCFSFENKFYVRCGILTTDSSEETFEKCRNLFLQRHRQIIEKCAGKLQEVYRNLI